MTQPMPARGSTKLIVPGLTRAAMAPNHLIDSFDVGRLKRRFQCFERRSGLICRSQPQGCHPARRNALRDEALEGHTRAYSGLQPRACICAAEARITAVATPCPRAVDAVIK